MYGIDDSTNASCVTPAQTGIQWLLAMVGYNKFLYICSCVCVCVRLTHNP